jgi:phosphate/sulfate permease
MLKTITHLLILALLCAAGTWLQWHEHFELSALGSRWSFATAIAPYALCIVVAFRSQSIVPAIAGATVALALDGIAHYDVFVRPNGSTAMLSFLFVPMMSTIVFVPLAMLITRALLTRHERREEDPRGPAVSVKLEPQLREDPHPRPKLVTPPASRPMS